MPDQREDLWAAKKFEAQYREPRDIQDEDIEETLKELRSSHLNNFLAHNTCAMLEELLKLRKKVRSDAIA